MNNDLASSKTKLIVELIYLVLFFFFYIWLFTYSTFNWVNHKNLLLVNNPSLILIGSSAFTAICVFLIDSTSMQSFLLYCAGAFIAGFAYGTYLPGKIILFILVIVIQIQAILILFSAYNFSKKNRFIKIYRKPYLINHLPKIFIYLFLIINATYWLINTIYPRYFNNQFWTFNYIAVGCILIILSFFSKNPIEKSISLLLGCIPLLLRIGTYMICEGDYFLYYIIPIIFLLLLMLENYFIKNLVYFRIKVLTLQIRGLILFVVIMSLLCFGLYILIEFYLRSTFK